MYSNRKGRIAKRMEKVLIAHAMDQDITNAGAEYNQILSTLIAQIFDNWGYLGVRTFAELSGLQIRPLNQIAYQRQESFRLREGYLRHLPAPLTETYAIPQDKTKVTIHYSAGAALKPEGVKFEEPKVCLPRRSFRPQPPSGMNNTMRLRVSELVGIYHRDIYRLFWHMGVKYGVCGIEELGRHLAVRTPDPQAIMQLIQHKNMRKFYR